MVRFPGRCLGRLLALCTSGFLASEMQGRARVLFLVYYHPVGLRTIQDNVSELVRRSRFPVDVMNLYHRLPWPGRTVRIPSPFDYSRYAALMIHNTVSYNADILWALDADHPTKIQDFRGVKVLFKQDEHYKTNRIAQYLHDKDFDLLLTVVRPEHLESFYPKASLPRLKFLHVLTGYVTDEMRALPYTQRDERPMDIGYRGSLQPLSFGRLAYEKRQIGDAFLKICAERGLTADISSRWEDRFMGADWFRFLGRCKGVLGVDSGASIVDRDGEVEAKCKAFLKAHPNAGFEELELLVITDLHQRLIDADDGGCLVCSGGPGPNLHRRQCTQEHGA